MNETINLSVQVVANCIRHTCSTVQYQPHVASLATMQYIRIGLLVPSVDLTLLLGRVTIITLSCA